MGVGFGGGIASKVGHSRETNIRIVTPSAYSHFLTVLCITVVLLRGAALKVDDAAKTPNT